MAKKMGRPKIPINQQEFEKLCYMQCTETEIASFFDCSVDTIENWCKATYGTTFSEIYKRKSEYGKISLRRTQFKIAEKSAAMAIFLGKQYLGQKDEMQQVHDVKNGILDELVGALNEARRKE